MKKLLLLLCLTLLLVVPAHFYTFDRPDSSCQVCPKARNEDMNCDCNYCEQKSFSLPMVEARMFDQRAKDYKYDQDEHFALPDYFQEEKDGEDDNLKLSKQKNINVAFLNPIKSMDDLIELNSGELISAQSQKSGSRKWMGQVQGPPMFLPDIIIDSKDEQNVVKKSRTEDLPFGRRYVMDEPIPVVDMVQKEKSELTQETKDIESELGEDFTNYGVPVIKLDTVAPRPLSDIKKSPILQMEPLFDVVENSSEEEKVVEKLPDTTTSTATPTTAVPSVVKKKKKSKNKNPKPKVEETKMENMENRNESISTGLESRFGRSTYFEDLLGAM